jgi:flagellar biosynthesis protein FlhF
MTSTEHAHIHVKSYFAANIPDAIEVARSELGADALLLNSRRAPPEASHLGAVEVVFGVDTAKRPTEPAPAEHATGLEDLRRSMDEMRTLIRSVATPSSRSRPRPIVEQVLLDAGLAPAIAAQIEESVTMRLNRRPVLEISRARKIHEWDPDSIVQETIEEIESLFSVKPELGGISALVGPPGTGKTTTLVKLAVTEGLLKRRPVRIVSADAERIGAAEQLRSYAAILGVPFECVETLAGLGQAVDNAPEGHLVLIDTPGLGPALFESVGMDLAMFLSRRQNIDTHLVLTATTRPGDMESAAKRFDVFRPAGLIFTRLDETDSTGSIAGEAIRSGKPLTWICSGQLIPEDIEPASKRRIAGVLVHQLPALLRSAA